MGSTKKPRAASERLTISTLSLIDRPLDRGLEFCALIAAVGVEFAEKRKQPEKRGHDQRAAVAVQNICGMDQGVQHQPCRIDENVPLLAFDLLPCVITRRVDRGPPCILPLPAETKPERLSVDGSPQPPRAIEPVKKHGAPSTGSSGNPNSRLGRKPSPHSQGRVMEQSATSSSFVGIDVSKDRLEFMFAHQVGPSPSRATAKVSNNSQTNYGT